MDNNNCFGMTYEIGDNTFFAISDLLDAAKKCDDINMFESCDQKEDVGMARAALVHAIASISIADYIASKESK